MTNMNNLKKLTKKELMEKVLLLEQKLTKVEKERDKIRSEFNCPLKDKKEEFNECKFAKFKMIYGDFIERMISEHLEKLHNRNIKRANRHVPSHTRIFL